MDVSFDVDDEMQPSVVQELKNFTVFLNPAPLPALVSSVEGEVFVKIPLGALLLLIQAESFPETGDSIKGLLTVRDQSGQRRVKTKIIERDDYYAFRHPVLLPSRHYIVYCLIRDYHLRYSHAGIQALTVIIREEFWIVGARRTIRSVVKRCVWCKAVCPVFSKTSDLFNYH
ncbi:integrase catalytic domain-containing protein [Trichonephila clavata]|uniref:Integrase catalytic domain-containing protein n=1 Tax=Trichonephila clavata TaxID=2740835 RepID=A0A8X6HLH8_TRICU|nr:integrase catalytic domain-containing protein [Trichonephila clavata]